MKRETCNHLAYLGAVFTIVAIASSAAAVPLDNGDFESGLSSWSTEGTVTIEQAGYGGNAAVLYEADSRGLSRIYQEFDIPASAQWLSFRYRLFSNSFGDSVVPPDSFSFLLTDQGSPSQRLIAVDEPELSFTKAMLYEDAHGVLVFDDSNLIFRSATPDAGGLYTVIVNVSGLGVETPARIEFSFANGDNNRNSLAVVDDVMLDCGAAFCCDPTTGEILPLDDGLVCTDDYCDASNQPQHDPIECCGDCADADADVVIMIVISGSVGDQQQLELQKDAAKALLERFANSDPKPKLAPAGRRCSPLSARAAKRRQYYYSIDALTPGSVCAFGTVGDLISCDDHDPFTCDSCSSGTCIHAPSPCQSFQAA